MLKAQIGQVLKRGRRAPSRPLWWPFTRNGVLGNADLAKTGGEDEKREPDSSKPHVGKVYPTRSNTPPSTSRPR
jgi:hypothetical protein